MPLPTIPLSATPGISWPAIPSRDAAGLLSILYQLEATQWLTPEQIQELQLKQLNSLLTHSLKTVPYYRKVFGERGLREPQALTLDAWRELPILTRDSLMQNRSELLSDSVPDQHKPLVEVKSSGSTGKPVQTETTAVTRAFWNAFVLRDHYWHRRDFRLPFAAIRFIHRDARYPESDHTSNWGPPTAIVHPTGPSSVLDIRTPVSKQVEWISQRRPAYLLTYPSNIQEIARYCMRHDIHFKGLREIRLFGEVVDDAVRKDCKDAWCVSATDGYSANEVGYIALQCPEAEHYHVQSETCFLEVIDEMGNPCRIGEVGRVLVTPIHNFAMPLLRYAIGDYAELGSSCACGRGLPVIKRVLGRSRNMLVLPNGDRQWPFFGLGSYRNLKQVRQHQLVQHSPREIEVKLVVDQPLTEEEREELRKKILRALGHSFHIIFTFHDSIPRSASGKYEEFISFVA